MMENKILFQTTNQYPKYPWKYPNQITLDPHVHFFWLDPPWVYHDIPHLAAALLAHEVTMGKLTDKSKTSANGEIYRIYGYTPVNQ